MIDLLKKQHAIDVSMYDEIFMNKTIMQNVEKAGCRTFEEYSHILAESKKEVQKLADSFQISYSEFFRNPLTFSVLERIILPELIFNNRNKKSKEIRIWSAACAGGQETYSMAILLEGFNNGNERIEYRIFGTDQDEAQINKARIGEFDIASIGNVTHKLEKQWFLRHGNKYAVIPELKKNIEFSAFDLFSEQNSSPPESNFGGFDIILCANLLFYYKNEFRRIIIDKIRGALTENGLVITGEAEREILMNFKFKESYPHSGIFRK